MGNQLDTTNRLAQHSSRATQRSNSDQVSQHALEQRQRTMVPWLDRKISALVAAIIAVVAADHPEVRAAILFGSVARHEERPLDDPKPSDVDLLLVVTPDPVCQRLPYVQQLSLWESIGNVQYRFRDTPCEVEVTLVELPLVDWDELFVANVARDGILLWARNEPDAIGVESHSEHTDEDTQVSASSPDTAERKSSGLPDAWHHLAEV